MKNVHQPTSPDWDRLYEIAAAQDGYFSTRQAAEAGYSRPLLHHHFKAGRITNIQHGIYRISHFPPGEHEDLVVIWLWSDRQSVFAYETALALHSLSDMLPSKVHLILPVAWRARRIRFPDKVIPHYSSVPETDRTWIGAIPVTSPARTVNDCSSDNISPNIIDQAVRQGIARGLFDSNMVAEAIAYIN